LLGRFQGRLGIGGLWSRQVMVMRGKGLYGLGQHQGLFNYRNSEVYLLQRNPTETALPILISNVGYGMTPPYLGEVGLILGVSIVTPSLGVNGFTPLVVTM